jgi:hypothetical protein
MTTFDPMTSEIRAEMDAFHAARKPAAARRTINAPAHLFEDSPKVKAVKIAGLLAAREDLARAMVARGLDAEIWLIGGGRESHQRFARVPTAPAGGLS